MDPGNILNILNSNNLLTSFSTPQIVADFFSLKEKKANEQHQAGDIIKQIYVVVY